MIVMMILFLVALICPTAGIDVRIRDLLPPPLPLMLHSDACALLSNAIPGPGVIVDLSRPDWHVSRMQAK